MFDDLKREEPRIVSESTEQPQHAPPPKQDAFIRPETPRSDPSYIDGSGCRPYYRGSEAIHALQSPISVDDMAHGFFIAGLFLVLFLMAKSFEPIRDFMTGTQPFQPSITGPITLMGLTLRNASNMEQVLIMLPFAAAACVITTTLVYIMSRDSRSREIGWTDSHLFLEYSGPLTLAVKWAAVDSVKQISRWDIFSGRQPVFLVTTAEGNQFRLKLSDIARKHNIGAFFSMVKSHSPNAKLEVDPNFASENSYTELWLKYFSTSAERQRSGLLEKEMLLDEGHYQVIGTVGGGGQGTAYLGIVRSESSVVNQTPTAKLPAVQSEAKNGKEEKFTLCDDQAKLAVKAIQHILPSDPQVLVEGSQVVLKEYVLPVHRGHLTAERTAEKLKAEAEILRRLDHKQIVKIQDAFIEDYRGYLVLEYVIGETLKSMVGRLGPRSEGEVIDWALQVCSILEYLHGLSPSVVHRDITPDNLMLQDDGLLKLVDFNVAYQVDSSSTATVVGKHSYIPPEQFRGKPTPQSDIYALGGTMHFLLTGQEPEPISKSHPRTVNEKVCEKLDEIVAKATSTSVTSRYATVQDLAAALRELKSKS